MFFSKPSQKLDQIFMSLQALKDAVDKLISQDHAEKAEITTLKFENESLKAQLAAVQPDPNAISDPDSDALTDAVEAELTPDVA